MAAAVATPSYVAQAPPNVSFVVRLFPRDGLPRPPSLRDPAPGKLGSGETAGQPPDGGTCRASGDCGHAEPAAVPAGGGSGAGGHGSCDVEGGGGGDVGGEAVHGTAVVAAWRRLVARAFACLPLTEGGQYDFFYAVQLQLAALTPRAALLLAPALSATGVRLPLLEWWDAARLPAFTPIPAPASPPLDSHAGLLTHESLEAGWHQGDATAACRLETHPYLWVMGAGLGLGLGAGGSSGGGSWPQLPHRARRARCSLRLRPGLAATAAAAAEARAGASGGGEGSQLDETANSGGDGAALGDDAAGVEAAAGSAAAHAVEVVVWEELDSYSRAAVAAAAAAASPYKWSPYFATSRRYARTPLAALPPGWLRGGLGLGPGGGGATGGGDGSGSPILGWWTSVVSYMYGGSGGTLYYCSTAACDPSSYSRLDGQPREAASRNKLQVERILACLAVRQARRLFGLARALLLPHAEVLRWLWPLADSWTVELVAVTVAAACCCFAEWLLLARLAVRWVGDVVDARGPQLDSDTAAIMRGRVWREAREGSALLRAWRENGPLYVICALVVYGGMHFASAALRWWSSMEALAVAVWAAIPAPELVTAALVALLEAVAAGLRWTGWLAQGRLVLQAGHSRAQAVDVATRASKQLLQIASSVRMLHDSAAGLTLRQVAAAACLEERVPAAFVREEGWLLRHLPNPPARDHARMAVRWFRNGGRQQQQQGAGAGQRRRRDRQQQQQQWEAEQEAGAGVGPHRRAGEDDAEDGGGRPVVWPEPLKLPGRVSFLDGDGDECASSSGGGRAVGTGGGGGGDAGGARSRAGAPPPPPRGFVCFITHGVMRQPALLLSPQLPGAPTYERDAIERWLAVRRIDPRTNIELRSYRLVPNDDLRRAIDDWARAAEAAAEEEAAEAGVEGQEEEEGG